MANAKFSMIRSVGTVGGMTLFSRISGLIRDIAFAQFLGSGAIADAFFVAFRIPNFFRRIFGEGALSVAFVPVYSEFETQYPESETRAFLDLM
ncbi:MAG: lipid II flippase MurJ, partial [Arenicellales bacterium]|nr:lipid II flippase MurJ [Arenicellales bacterium]